MSSVIPARSLVSWMGGRARGEEGSRESVNGEIMSHLEGRMSGGEREVERVVCGKAPEYTIPRKMERAEKEEKEE